MKRLSLIFLLVCALVPTDAFAELYKYETKDGEIIITSQKRRDLKLVEVFSTGKSRKPKARKKSSRKLAIPTTRVAPPASKKLPMRKRELQFDDHIREAAKSYNVPFGFVKAVIRVESAFNPSAVSHAGAMGLMQLMPRTAAAMNVKNPYDARENIFGGTKFLRVLIDRYDGNINLILAAYNAGDVAVAKYKGIPYEKTRGYVASVYRWYQHYSAQN